MRARNPGKGLRDHEYDYDDDFIDDSEMLAYLGGDRRRTKHSGFFINKARACMFIGVSDAPLPQPVRGCAESHCGCKESYAAFVSGMLAACGSGSICLLLEWYVEG